MTELVCEKDHGLESPSVMCEENSAATGSTMGEYLAASATMIQLLCITLIVFQSCNAYINFP